VLPHLLIDTTSLLCCSCPDRALDTHIYQAWADPSSRAFFYNDACQQKHYIANMEREFGPVVVGEWSLATDNCAMWLNGFNDNLSGFPRLPCKYIPCSPPYMGTEQPGTPLDPSKPIQGPYGTGMSGPIFGYVSALRLHLVPILVTLFQTNFHVKVSCHQRLA
jgi:glucan 1,3-beta-glucosidase